MRRHLLRDIRGVAVVEFAIVAPVFFLFLFGIFETGRMLWTWQALQETAYATARCVAIGDVQCDTDDLAAQYAISHLKASRITLSASNVTITHTTTCNGVSNMDQVSLALPYGSPVSKLVPGIPDTLSVAACMPG